MAGSRMAMYRKMAVVVYFSNERSGPTIPGRTNQRKELVTIIRVKHKAHGGDVTDLLAKQVLSPIIFEANAKITAQPQLLLLMLLPHNVCVIHFVLHNKYLNKSALHMRWALAKTLFPPGLFRRV